MVQQVGRTIVEKTMKSGKQTRSYLTYKDIPKDYDDWVNAKLYLPKKYDLVHLRMSDGSYTKGWRSESFWDGRKFKPHLKVIAWKKAEEMIPE